MTHLIRVGKENYGKLHQLAGKIQAKTGKRASVDQAITWLFMRKFEALDDKIGAKTPKSEGKTGDSMRLFSLKQKKFID